MKLKKVACGQKKTCAYRMCYTGRNMEKLIPNIYEAVEGCLSVDIEPSSISENDKILELAV